MADTKPCKRYLAFSYLTYYPLGAAQDFCGDFGSVEEAVMECLGPGVRLVEWLDILDTETGEWFELEYRDYERYATKQIDIKEGGNG